MRKIIYFVLLFLKNIIATDYPLVADDRQVNVFATIATSVFNSGDTISIGSGATDQGLCWLKTRLDTNGTGTGYVQVATPLPVYTGLYLSDWNILDIQKDMFLSADCALMRSGKISSGAVSRGESSLILMGYFNLNDSTISFTNSASTVDQANFIDGNGNVIDFSLGGAIKSDTGPRGELKIRNAYLRGLRTSNSLLAQTGDLTLDNIILELHGNYSTGSSRKALNIYGDIVVTGTYNFAISGPCNFYDDARLYIGLGTTFVVGTGATFNFYGTKTGGLHFNGCEIYIANNDFVANEGNIIFENEVTVVDNNSYRHVVIGPNCTVNSLATARIILESTSTFSVL